MFLKLRCAPALVAFWLAAGASFGDAPELFGPYTLGQPQSSGAEQEISMPWVPPAGTELPKARLAQAVPPASNSASASGTIESEALPERVRPPELQNDFAASESEWYQPTYWFGPAPWDTGIELGVNGSSGNEDSFSLRAGGYIKRESRFSKLDLTTDYNRTSKDGSPLQNNAQLDVRNDWLLDEDSPWTLFATTNAFYDQFQAYDVQLSADTGVGYRFVHQPRMELIGRVGGGVSREFGGPDSRTVPESLFGIEYSHKFATTQKFYSKIDYFPEWDEVGEFRLVGDVGWEVELVQPSNLSLKISVTDRYDSTPNGADPQLLNYAVLMLMKL
jgi:putative salt-induced outer membrane protein YdiY